MSVLRNWLCSNGLCLNPEKSESILFGTHQRLRNFPNIPSVNIAGTDIKLENKLTSLGVTMDSSLSFNHHVTSVCKSSHFHLRSLRHIRRSITNDVATSIAVALVQSRLDYCNSLLSGISNFNINKLQRVQNLAARLSLNDWHTSSSQLLTKLHWLPINSRIKFKIGTLTFKLLTNKQPAHLCALLQPVVSTRLTRSSDQQLLVQPRVRTSIGQRAFSICGPNIWNSIPLPIRLSPSISIFKRNLKTYLFNTA